MKKLLILMLLTASPLFAADWTLSSKESTFNFMSTKNAAVTELHTFQNISGEINGDKGKLNIDLASVETQIPIRNDRMKEHLFDTKQFPQATVELNLAPNVFESLQKAGSMTDLPVKANLGLHGMKKEISAKLRIIKLADNKFVASTLEPILLIPGDFGLEPGLKKLMEIAKLNSITNSVPVTFSLVFEKK
ncbi:MAG: YceI family protein [Methylicorpusculum sp.]|uniref:YceI family protein n=1 Tax=Methylicorpusculum sp. TaxID=2713644 RepID=UPI002723AD90|nr:YceI family protein [Methylicorpusculum sp.]MDO8843343.1 YceI family protein [Methylicorpusculum sp.]MDO8939220.1 YceI family protein [Methylicorpusculum sp.]MDP2204164.1 YceI family protein [Methylicorpusculum sp.]